MSDVRFITMTNGGPIFCDAVDYRKFKNRRFFKNHETGRDYESMLTLAQLILETEKGAKIYYKDENQLNCCRDNISRKPFKKVRKLRTGKFIGVEYREYPHPLCSGKMPGWVAFYKEGSKRCIAGPFETDRQAAEAYNLVTGKEVNSVEPFKPKGGKQLEAVIEKDVMHYMRLRGWWVHKTVMGVMEQGLPDLIAIHPRYGVRFIDIKNPSRHSITPAQEQTWPLMQAFGAGPYIMVAADDREYKKLFQPCNYADFFMKHGANSEMLNKLHKDHMAVYTKSETKKCDK